MERARRSGSQARQLAVLGAAAVVVLAPALIGGGPAWSQVVASAAAWVVCAFYVVASKGSVRLVPLTAAAAVAIAITFVQILPLPAVLVNLLSSHVLAIRGEALGAPPSFLPLTYDVPATVIALARGMACFGLLVAIGSAARRAQRARVLVLTLAFAGAAMAVLALVQRRLGVQAILGVYQLHDQPGAGIFGTFVNSNHAASFFALSALVAIGVAVETLGPLRWAAAGSAALSGVVLAMTSSRAGAAGFAVGAAVLVALVIGARWGRVWGVIAAAAFFAVGTATVLWAAPSFVSRSVTAEQTAAWNNQKVRGWQAAARVVAAHPWTGVGRGAFEAPTTAHRTDVEGVRLAYPENLPLQLGSEWGIPMTALLVILVLVALKRIGPLIPQLEPSVQGAACGVLAILVHELADFGLETTGVALPAVAALAVVLARAEETRDPARDEPIRIGWKWTVPTLAFWGIALMGAIWALPRTLRGDGERARAAVTARDTQARSVLTTAVARHPADYYLEILSALHAMQAAPSEVLRHVNRAQRLYPAEGTAHLMAARWLARLGRRSQAALEYRLAEERKANAGLEEILAVVGPELMASAVAQTGESLMNAARFLMAKGRPSEADRLSRRAVELGGSSAEKLAVARLALAVDYKASGAISAAARDLVVRASRPESFITAAQALIKAGEPDEADRVITQGLVNHPQHGSLVLTGVRQHVDRGDVRAATVLIQKYRSVTYTLTERVTLEELASEIAQKVGDVVGASAARARARTLTRFQKEADDKR